ncbi:fic family toxin-antitoxin system, toxin component [Streptomyces sp. NPDC053427]|uniref:fic family toxin-antitoxin system, toxin component n=1 Tax=Streptomyces sp. NPDC053427 TaxID=3365701 RepID=UPI0037CD5D2A
MAPIVTIDEGWLLDVAQQHVPGDPDVTDYGALAAAVGRHRFAVLGTLVYPEVQDRAAALLHSLARVPALEHSNELYAAMVAYAYLAASGRSAKVGTDDVVELVAAVVDGRMTVREVAAAVKTWTEH